MPKTADEKLEALERTARNYRLLSISLLVLVMVMKRDTISNFLDRMEGWMGNVAQAKAEPVDDR